MANHRFQGNIYTLEKFPVALFAYMTSADYSVTQTNGTDIKTASKSLGIASIVETATGVFKITLKQAYNSLLAVIPTFVDDTSADVEHVDVTDEDVDGATPYIKVTLSDASAAQDLPDDCIVLWTIILRNSAAG